MTALYALFALLSISTVATAAPGRDLITVRTSGHNPNDALIVGGTENTVSVLELSTVLRDGATLTDFTLQNCVTHSSRPDKDGDCADMGEVWGADSAVDMVTVWFYTPDGSIDFAVGLLVEGIVEFAGEDIFVPYGLSGDTAFLVIDVLTDDGTDAEPGDAFQFNWIHQGAEAIDGEGNSIPESEITHFAGGSTQMWEKTVPTFSLHRDSPSGPGGTGMEERVIFTIAADSADPHSYLLWEMLQFDLYLFDEGGVGWNRCIGDGGSGSSASRIGLARDDFELVDITSGVEAVMDLDIDWTLLNVAGAECLDGEEVGGVRVWPAEAEIDEDEARTYALKVRATGAQADDAIAADVIDVSYGYDGYWSFGQYVSTLPVEGLTIIIDPTRE